MIMVMMFQNHLEAEHCTPYKCCLDLNFRSWLLSVHWYELNYRISKSPNVGQRLLQMSWRSVNLWGKIGEAGCGLRYLRPREEQVIVATTLPDPHLPKHTLTLLGKIWLWSWELKWNGSLPEFSKNMLDKSAWHGKPATSENQAQRSDMEGRGQLLQCSDL